MEAGTRLGCSAIATTGRDSAGTGPSNADYGAGASARARDNISQLASCVFEAAGSEPAKNGVPSFRSARIEDAAGGDQRLLRSDADGFAGTIVGQAKGHTGRIQGKLRAAGPGGAPV